MLLTKDNPIRISTKTLIESLRASKRRVTYTFCKSNGAYLWRLASLWLIHERHRLLSSNLSTSQLWRKRLLTDWTSTPSRMFFFTDLEDIGGQRTSRLHLHIVLTHYEYTGRQSSARLYILLYPIQLWLLWVQEIEL